MLSQQQQDEFDAFESRLEALRDQIDAALIKVENGEIPGMLHLDNDVQKLCKDIERASPPVKSQLQMIMGDIIGTLDTLEYKLRILRETMEG